MTPQSGAISLANVRTELGLSGAISLGDSTVRDYLFVSSGAISLNNAYAVYKDTLSANTANVNMKSRAIAAGWNQTTPIKHTLNINSGVYAYGQGSYGLETGSTFPSGSGLRVNNAGIIVGQGGVGGNGSSTDGGTGGNGGTGLLAQYALQVNNTGRIAGGGGGGGGGPGLVSNYYDYTINSAQLSGGYGGMGGNGGRGAGASSISSAGGSGGAAFTVSFAGGNWTGFSGPAGLSGSPYVIVSGADLQSVLAWIRPDGGGTPVYYYLGNGAPGDWGASGYTSGSGLVTGGSWGYNSYYANGAAGAGGAGGACTSGAATYITWIATGTRNGTIG